jgi:hypothetical protein
MSPIRKDTEMVLERTEPVKPQENLQIPAKVFCADRNTARTLLKGIILMVGAMRELEIGNVDEKNTPIVAVRVQEFLLNLGDQLLIDTGMNEAVIAEISQEIRMELQRKGGSDCKNIKIP